MIRNLVAAGHDVRAFDLAARALERAAEAGASVASSMAEALPAAETVLTMSPRGRDVRAAYLGGERPGDGIIGFAPNRALLIDCSTIDVASAWEVAAGATAASLFQLRCRHGAGEIDCGAVYRLVHGDT